MSERKVYSINLQHMAGSTCIVNRLALALHFVSCIEYVFQRKQLCVDFTSLMSTTDTANWDLDP